MKRRAVRRILVLRGVSKLAMYRTLGAELACSWLDYTRFSERLLLTVTFNFGSMIFTISEAFGLLAFAVSALCSSGGQAAMQAQAGTSTEIYEHHDMGALSETFTVLRHPAFPRYSTRIKKTDFCDTTSQ